MRTKSVEKKVDTWSDESSTHTHLTPTKRSEYVWETETVTGNSLGRLQRVYGFVSITRSRPPRRGINKTTSTRNGVVSGTTGSFPLCSHSFLSQCLVVKNTCIEVGFTFTCSPGAQGLVTLYTEFYDSKWFYPTVTVHGTYELIFVRDEGRGDRSLPGWDNVVGRTLSLVWSFGRVHVSVSSLYHCEVHPSPRRSESCLGPSWPTGTRLWLRTGVENLNRGDVGLLPWLGPGTERKRTWRMKERSRGDT